VKFSIQESAERDILRQVEWYAEQGLPEIAQRFCLATKSSIGELLSTPLAGPAEVRRQCPTWGPSHLVGARLQRIPHLYLVQGDLIKVIRVLHGKRDIASILERETVDQPKDKDRL
jgi:plasmid stabilization system protein ParE